MTTFTVNEDSKAAKAFLAFIKTLSFVEIKEENSYVAEEQSPYGKEFVEKIKDRADNDDFITIDPKTIWEDL
jgi:hypothetical protein